MALGHHSTTQSVAKIKAIIKMTLKEVQHITYIEEIASSRLVDWSLYMSENV